MLVLKKKEMKSKSPLVEILLVETLFIKKHKYLDQL